MLFSTRGAASLQEAEQSQVKYVGLRQSSTQGRGNLSKDLGKMGWTCQNIVFKYGASKRNMVCKGKTYQKLWSLCIFLQCNPLWYRRSPKMPKITVKRI